jgi:hypothetical protein
MIKKMKNHQTRVGLNSGRPSKGSLLKGQKIFHLKIRLQALHRTKMEVEIRRISISHYPVRKSL